MGKNLKTVHMGFPDRTNNKKRYEIHYKLLPSFIQLSFKVFRRVFWNFADGKNQNGRYYGKNSIVEAFQAVEMHQISLIRHTFSFHSNHTHTQCQGFSLITTHMTLE